MRHERNEYRKPHGRGDYELLQRRDGLYWQGHEGLILRLAAAERETATETEDRRVSKRGHPSEIGPALFAR